VFNFKLLNSSPVKASMTFRLGFEHLILPPAEVMIKNLSPFFSCDRFMGSGLQNLMLNAARAFSGPWLCDWNAVMHIQL
jgi:hypothetical protein